LLLIIITILILVIVLIIVFVITIIIIIIIIITTQGLSLMLACLSPSLRYVMQVKVSKQQGTAVAALMWTAWTWKSLTMLTVNQLC